MMKEWKKPELWDLSIEKTAAWNLGSGNDQYVDDNIEGCIDAILQFFGKKGLGS
jgi:hypothetical protein